VSVDQSRDIYQVVLDPVTFEIDGAETGALRENKGKRLKVKGKG
jgi:hypothetical protein